MKNKPDLKNKAAQELGRLGGLKKTEAKAAAVRENGKLGGRPPGPGKAHGLSTGRKPLPPGLKRPRFSTTVAPETLTKLQSKAAETPGSNLGRVLDELASAYLP